MARDYKSKLWIKMFMLMGSFLTEAKNINRIEYLTNDILPESQPGTSIKPKKENNVIMNGNKESFETTIEEMDKILGEFDTPCAMYDPEPPNFVVKERRHSEIKCLQHIWYMKKEEDTERRVEECRSLYMNEYTGIIGGRKSKPAEFPHMGALGWKTIEKRKWAFKCGSFLISDKFALTAAHCYYDEFNNKPEIVRFGVIDINSEKINEDQPPVDVGIRNFISHPKYKPEPFKAFDIALIELKEQVSFNEFIQPICILNQQVDNAVITGWGVTDAFETDKNSDHLQVADVDVLSNENCSKKWHPKFDSQYWTRFLRSQMCATNLNRIADICGGDSGSPLQAKLYVNTKKPIYNAVGITSHNSDCGSRIFPSVYTKISCFIDWIEEVVWGVKRDPTKRNECEEEGVHREPKAQKGIAIHSVQNYTTGFLFHFNSSKFRSHWAYINRNLIEHN